MKNKNVINQRAMLDQACEKLIFAWLIAIIIYLILTGLQNL